MSLASLSHSAFTSVYSTMQMRQRVARVRLLQLILVTITGRLAKSRYFNRCFVLPVMYPCQSIHNCIIDDVVMMLVNSVWCFSLAGVYPFCVSVFNDFAASFCRHLLLISLSWWTVARVAFSLFFGPKMSPSFLVNFSFSSKNVVAFSA